MIVDERTKATSYHLIPEVSWIVKCSDSRGVLMDAAQMAAPPSDFFTEFYEPRCASGYRFLAGLRHGPYMKIQISRDVEAHFGCRSDLGDELETRHTARVGHLTVELSCGPATPTRTNKRHCTGLTEPAAQRVARQLQRLVRRHGAPHATGRLRC